LATAVGLEDMGESEARVDLAMKAAQQFEDFAIACKKAATLEAQT
jgi:hypothetical protein